MLQQVRFRMAAVEDHGLGGLTLVRADGMTSQRVPLVEKRFLFGRAENCDARIEHISVSREHAEIFMDENNQVWVRSLSKTAETKVDGITVREILLTDGAKIGIGGHFFIYDSISPGIAKKVRAAAL